MKERTLAELSGIHFRYMKACAQRISLVEFEAIICYIPYCTGYSLKEWQKAINTMIEKKGKGYKVMDL